MMTYFKDDYALDSLERQKLVTMDSTTLTQTPTPTPAPTLALTLTLTPTPALTLALALTRWPSGPSRCSAAARVRCRTSARSSPPRGPSRGAVTRPACSPARATHP